MVNLNVFKIRITSTFPSKYRDSIRESIEDTFLQALINYTHYFRGISSKKLWKLIYIPWNGFYIQAEDTKTKNYASIVNWINYGTSKHFIPDFSKFQKMIDGRIEKKFLIFPERKDYKQHEKIKGNQTFVQDGFVFTLIVQHPGIEAKRFVESIIEDIGLNNNFYRLIDKDLNLENMELEEYLKFLNKISTEYRYPIGITS